MMPRDNRKATQSPRHGGATAGDSTSRKRKDINDEQPTSSKRARYTTIACNGCKQRKLKCDGQVPCRRCEDVPMACIYQDDRFNINQDSTQVQNLKDQMKSMQEKLDFVIQITQNSASNVQQARVVPAQNTVDEVESAGSTNVGSSHTSKSELAQIQALCPGFRGHTSSTFVFNAAKRTMRHMGIEPGMSKSRSVTPVAPRPEFQSASSCPLAGISKMEAIRLCQSYSEGVGTMYPMVDMGKLLDHLESLFPEESSEARRAGGRTSRLGLDSHYDTDILELVLAISLTCESGGRNPIAETLYRRVRGSSDLVLWDLVGLQGVQILALMALYHGHLDEDVRGCRIAGLAARLCLETGLHRREILVHTFPGQKDQCLAVRIFWSVYTLDRRSSLGTGIPFVLQDADIDPCLPEPDSAYPYLCQVIVFARLSGKAWNVTNGFAITSTDFKMDEIVYLDFQLLQWQKRLPESLSYIPQEPISPVGTPGKATTYVRAILHARTSHLRNILYRRVLDSPSRINANLEHARNVVEIAKDTIKMLSTLHKKTIVYQSHPIVFNHFLVGALGVLLLAVTNAPVEFGETVCTEYYVALEIIEGLRSKSRIVMQLWKTVDMLPALGLKLGLTPKSSPEATDYSLPTDTAPLSGQISRPPLSAISGSHIRDDFANLFETTLEGSGFDFQSFDVENGLDVLSGQLHETYSGAPSDDPWLYMPSSL